MTLEPSALAEANAHCEALVKEADRGAWLATLFAPADRRPAFHALQAFLIEIGSVRGKVREPLAGELRLQWWTDAIEGETRGDVRGHPVAAALLDAIRRHHLSRPTLTGIVEAKRDDLYDEPIATTADFDAWAASGEGRVFALKAAILGVLNSVVDDASRHAGRAVATLNALRLLDRGGVAGPEMRLPLDLLAEHGIGRAEMLVGRSLPAVTAVRSAMASRGRAELASLRQLRRAIDPTAAPAFLSVNVVEPLLARADGTATPGSWELPQWRQQWLLWRASRRNGIL